MIIQNIEIYQATTDHVDLLREIGIKTFEDTFSENNSAQNMSKYLEEQFSADKLLAELNTTGSEFFLATLNNKTIGYLKINSGSAQTEPMEDKSIEIERIYVLKDYHGRKVGQILYDFSLQIALQKQMNFIWLGVWEKNTRAIQFYKKNGFIEFSKHIFLLGNDEQTDIMMKLDLTEVPFKL